MVDLGTGHGLICRALAKHFDSAIGVDPSEGMIRQARSSTSKDEYPNVNFVNGSAEALPFLSDESVDLVVAGQAAHWFHQPTFFREMKRVVRPGGSIALWGYNDHVFPGHPKASELIQETAYGKDNDLLGPYWQEPGRSIVHNFLRDIEPPLEDWDVKRNEHVPGTENSESSNDALILRQRMTPEMNMLYMRTWSSYHAWKETHPESRSRLDGGNGDVIDKLFDQIEAAEPDWAGQPGWRQQEIDVEWGTALILARRKQD